TTPAGDRWPRRVPEVQSGSRSPPALFSLEPPATTARVMARARTPGKPDTAWDSGDPAGVCPLRRRLPLAADQRPRTPARDAGSRAPGGALCAPTTPKTAPITPTAQVMRTAMSCRFAAGQAAPALRWNG